jgi:hypothetical protein
MRRWFAALSLLGSLSLHAQSPVWALHGVHNTVYVAESVHLLKPDQSALPPAFDRAYADASTLVMEMDLSRIDATQLQMWMLQHGTLQDGVTLQQALGAQLYARIAAQAPGFGMPLDALQQLKPWVIALMLTDLQYVRLGFDPQAGVEKQLMQRATRDGKQIAGLESIDEELGQLDALPPQAQARFLELTLEDLKDAEHDTDELLYAWRSGDTQRLAALLSEEYKAFPELYRALVTERNERWLPQLQAFLKADHNYFVVVGALHVVGTGGLLDLARRAGIVVTPLRVAVPRG